MRTRKSSKNNKMMILMTLVILAAAVAYIATVMRPESAAEMYFNAEKQNIDRILQKIDETYTGFMTKKEPYLKSVYRRRIELTSDIKSGVEIFSKNSGGQVGEIIKTSKLVVDTVRSPSEGVSATEASLLIRKTPLMGMELFTREGKLFCSIPVLMPKRYFSTRFDQLDEVYDKLSLPVKPKKLLDDVAVAQVLKFDKSAFTEAAAKIAGIFKKYVTGDDVKYGQDKEVIISGRTVRGKEVIISLSEEAATPLFRELARASADSGLFLEYTYGNIAGLSGLLNDAGLFRLLEYLDETGTISFSGYEKNIIGGLNLDKDVEGFAEALKETAENYRLSDGFSMALVIDGDKNILERKLTLEIVGTAEGNKSSYTLEICTGSSNTKFEDARNRFVDIVLTEYGVTGKANAAPKTTATIETSSGETFSGETSSGGTTGAAKAADASESISVSDANTDRAVPIKTTEFRIMPSFEKTAGTETKGTVEIRYAIREGTSVTGFDLDLDISESMDGETQKRNRITLFRANIFSDGGKGTIEGDIDSYSWENKKLNSTNYTSKINIGVNLPFQDINNFSATLYLAGEDRFGTGAPKLPELIQESVTDLNAATRKDLDRIKIEALASFGELYLSNKALFDSFLGQ